MTLDDALAEFDQHFADHNFSAHFKAAACIAEYISQLESALKSVDKNGYLLSNCRILAEKYVNMPTDEEKYEVIVGNIGTVFSGSSRDEAYHQFHAYVDLSVDGVGRASFEDVTLMLNGEPVKEHHGSIDNDEDFAGHVDPRAWNYEEEE